MSGKTPYPPCVIYPQCQSRECCSAGHKYIWPNVVGMDHFEAKAIIERDNPLATVVFVAKDGATIDNFCCNRVYVFVDEHLKVSSEPALPMVG
ncbi:UNVERIFIED_CONTAM: hypothetical protein Scaly_2614700 [Sesamum calycinum]|uniref:Uncharacterized protein n=1 Tax=Sesamum calycinum TaxID=2727403 RepID=A0AAW2JBA3_9LAMI